MPYPHAAGERRHRARARRGLHPGELDLARRPGPTAPAATGRRASPGTSCPGSLVELGYGTTGLTVGQRVFGLTDWARNGIPGRVHRGGGPQPRPPRRPTSTTRWPRRCPISGLTAWQGLFDHARPHHRPDRPRPRRARAASARSPSSSRARWARRVIGTGRAADRDIGARPRRADLPRPGRPTISGTLGEVDVVFDVIGGDVLERSAALVRPGGILVTIAVPPTVRPGTGGRSSSSSNPTAPGWPTSPSGSGPDGSSRSSAPCDRSPRRPPRSPATDRTPGKTMTVQVGASLDRIIPGRGKVPRLVQVGRAFG